MRFGNLQNEVQNDLDDPAFRYRSEKGSKPYGGNEPVVIYRATDYLLN